MDAGLIRRKIMRQMGFKMRRIKKIENSSNRLQFDN